MADRTILDDYPKECAALIEEARLAGAWHALAWLVLLNAALKRTT
jgi:hypothetical protein